MKTNNMKTNLKSIKKMYNKTEKINYYDYIYAYIPDGGRFLTSDGIIDKFEFHEWLYEQIDNMEIEKYPSWVWGLKKEQKEQGDNIYNYNEDYLIVVELNELINDICSDIRIGNLIGQGIFDYDLEDE